MEIENKSGKVMWMDLTIKDAESISNFYKEVVGWEIEKMKVNDCEDYVMKNPENDEAIAGICHAKGSNKDLPPQWLVYISVDNLDKSLENCRKLGGNIIGEKRSYGEGKYFCLIQDPAGAYVMLSN